MISWYSRNSRFMCDRRMPWILYYEPFRCWWRPLMTKMVTFLVVDKIWYFCHHYDIPVGNIKLLRLKVRVNPFWPDVCVFHNLYNSTWSIWSFRRFSSRLDFWFSKISQFRLKASFLPNFDQFWHISWCLYSLGYFYRLLIRQKTTKLIETQVQFHSNTRILFMCSLVEYHI